MPGRHAEAGSGTVSASGEPAASRGSARTRPSPDTESAPGMRRLDPAAVTYWRLDTLWRGAVLAAPALALELTTTIPLPSGLIAGTIAALTVALTLFVPPLRYAAWGFALRESDLYLEHGVLSRTSSIVPLARIQHVDTRHGPIHRRLGLAAVVVYTAGTRGAVLEIPALRTAEAEALRDRLVALSGAGDAV